MLPKCRKCSDDSSLWEEPAVKGGRKACTGCRAQLWKNPCMEKGKRENSASFCFLRTGSHFSQCPRALPRSPQQGSEDTGKGARLGRWENGNPGYAPQAVKLWNPEPI